MSKVEYQIKVLPRFICRI